MSLAAESDVMTYLSEYHRGALCKLTGCTTSVGIG